MNYGRNVALFIAGVSFLASVGYFIQGDIRRGFYYLFAAAITVTVSY